MFQEHIKEKKSKKEITTVNNGNNSHHFDFHSSVGVGSLSGLGTSEK